MIDWPTVTPLTGEPELARLRTVAADDAHQVVGATHVVRLEDDIVGYFGLGGAVAVTFWLHSQRIHARQGITLINVAENLIRGVRPGSTVLVPLDGASPFLPVMAKLGYAPGSPNKVFLKRL